MIGLLIGTLLLGALGPTIFEKLGEFKDNGNLTATEKAVAAVFGVFVIIGFLVLILKMVGIKVPGLN